MDSIGIVSDNILFKVDIFAKQIYTTTAHIRLDNVPRDLRNIVKIAGGP